MGMSAGSATGVNLLQDWNNIVKNVREAMQPAKNPGLGAYYAAKQNCDKAMENVMDKHHESVAASAKKMKEYRKKKAREDAIREAAREVRITNQEAADRAYNYREFMRTLRLKDDERRAMFEAVA